MVKFRSLVVAAGLGMGLGGGLSALAAATARADRDDRDDRDDRARQGDGSTPKLAEARRAADELRYDRAQELLGEALREGKSSPDTMVRIYELAASTAVVLGNDELAELYYRRLLCIDPRADLEAGLAPKFKRPFAAARAYVSAHGALRSRARRSGDSVAIFVESDPLAMVASVALARGGEVGRGVALDPSRRARLPIPEAEGGEASELRLLLVDEFGNQLQLAPVPAETAAPELTASGPPAAAASRSFLRTWWIWTIPAAASLGVGIAAGLQSQQASDDLDALLRQPNPHYDEAEELRQRSRSRATIANVSFGAAGVLTAVALIMLATRPDAPPASATALAPVGPDGSLGLSLSGPLPF